MRHERFPSFNLLNWCLPYEKKYSNALLIGALAATTLLFLGGLTAIATGSFDLIKHRIDFLFNMSEVAEGLLVSILSISWIWLCISQFSKIVDQGNGFQITRQNDQIYKTTKLPDGIPYGDNYSSEEEEAEYQIEETSDDDREIESNNALPQASSETSIQNDINAS